MTACPKVALGELISRTDETALFDPLASQTESDTTKEVYISRKSLQ